MIIEISTQNDVCTVRFEGRLVAGVDPEFLRLKSDEIKALNCTRLLVDFRQVPQVGSTGIGFIVGLYSSVTKNPEGRFVIVGLQPRVREVLDLTRLSTVLPIAADIQAGLALLVGRPLGRAGL